MTFKTLLVAAALALSVSAPASAALLDGNSVTASLHSLDTLGNTINGTPDTQTAPATSLVAGSFLSATYADKQITVQEDLANSSTTFFTSNFLTGTPFVTNGLEFFSPLAGLGFTSVTIDPTSTVSGAGVTFSANIIDLNLAGLTFNFGDTVVLDLNGGPEPGVPEPATWALMLAGFGLAGTGLRVARRRRTIA
jgi:hypothetical protein